ncbi:hypothetical protein RJ55_04766 [Drechmeria coniospora]|nr:hypothetical protein RJ55_04766 [Drechmeria coniospora]
MRCYPLLIAALADLLMAASAPRPAAHYRMPLPVDGQAASVDGQAASVAAKKVGPQVGHFVQPIDHRNPSRGNFTQRFWWNADYYRGPGSPVIMMAPIEDDPSWKVSWMNSSKLPGAFAEAVGGAIVMMEHRYYGESSPVANLTAETLQPVNLDNMIQDIAGSSKPDMAPWVLTGCSYAGALTAWTHHFAPGTFWAYHASCATVQAIESYSAYWDAVEAVLPRNCSADMKQVMAHIDDVFTTGTNESRQEIKTRFGFGDLKHDDDFLAALAETLPAWQAGQFFHGDMGVTRMCNYVENIWPADGNGTGHFGTATAEIPGKEGVGGKKAMDGLSKWYRELAIPETCSWYDDYYKDYDKNTVECFDTYNPLSPRYTNTSTSHTWGRQYEWVKCNEPWGQFRVGGPNATNGIVSKHYTSEYRRRQCDLLFPETNGYKPGLAMGRTVESLNKRTGGWNAVNTTRLMWVNGQYDPWRGLTVAAHERPGGPLNGTTLAPHWILPNASHCSDMWMENGKVNPVIDTFQKQIIKKMTTWVREFYTQHGKAGTASGGGDEEVDATSCTAQGTCGTTVFKCYPPGSADGDD